MTWRIDVTERDPYRALELLQDEYVAKAGSLPPSTLYREVQDLLQRIVRSSPFGYTTRYTIVATGHSEGHGESGGFNVHVAWWQKNPSLVEAAP